MQFNVGCGSVKCLFDKINAEGIINRPESQRQLQGRKEKEKMYVPGILGSFQWNLKLYVRGRSRGWGAFKMCLLIGGKGPASPVWK